MSVELCDVRLVLVGDGKGAVSWEASSVGDLKSLPSADAMLLPGVITFLPSPWVLLSAAIMSGSQQ